MAYDIGPKIGIDGEAEFRKNLRNISQSIKTLGSEMKSVTSAFSGQEKSVESLNARNRVLHDMIDAQKRKMTELAKGVDNAAAKWGDADSRTQKWRQALYEANAELNRMESELQQNEAEIRDFGKETTTAADAADDAAKKTSVFADVLKAELLSDAITAGIRAIADGIKAAAGAMSGFVKDSIDTAKEFDYTMSSVQAISGATAEEFDALREKAIELGGKTKFSANEAAEGLTYMAMAGWKADDMLDGLGGIMHLAAASGEELGLVSDIVTDALTAFKLSADDAGHFADVLAAASANSNTNVAMLGESFQYVAGTAGAMKYSAEDTAIALGLMANSGTKASRAGTSLNNMLTRMANPTKQSGNAMDMLGLSLKDGEGNMKSLMEIMQDLRDEFGSLQMPLGEFQSALSALDSALDDGKISEDEYGESLDKLIENAYGVDAAMQAQAAAMLAGKTGMSGLLAIINASDADFEKLSSAIYSASDAADGYSGAAERMAAVTENNLQGDLTSLNSALETLKIRIADQITPTLREFTQYGISAVRDMTAAFESDGLSGVFDVLADKIREGMTTLQDIGPALLSTLADTISDAIPHIYETGASILPGLADGIKSGLSQLADAAGNIMSSLGGYLRENLPTILKTGLETVKELSGSIRENAGKFVDAAVKLALDFAQGLADSIPDIVRNVPTIVSNIAGVINDNAPKILLAAGKIMLTLGKGLIDAIPVIVQELPKIIKAIWDVFTAFNWLNLGKNIITAIKNGITNLKNALPEALKNIGNSAKNTLKNTNWLELGKTIITTIVKGIINIQTTIPRTLLKVGKSALTAFKEIDWLSLGKAIIDGIAGGIGKFASLAVSSVKNLAKSIFGGAKDELEIASPSKKFRWIGKMSDRGLALGIKSNAGLVKTAMDSVTDAMAFGASLAQYTPYAAANAPTAIPGAAGISTPADAETLAQAISGALSGVGVYLDGQRTGAIINRINRNNYRATGAV